MVLLMLLQLNALMLLPLNAWPSCARCPRAHAHVCTCAHIHTQNTHTWQGVAGVIGALAALDDGGIVPVNLSSLLFWLLLVQGLACSVSRLDARWVIGEGDSG